MSLTQGWVRRGLDQLAFLAAGSGRTLGGRDDDGEDKSLEDDSKVTEQALPRSSASLLSPPPPSPASLQPAESIHRFTVREPKGAELVSV